MRTPVFCFGRSSLHLAPFFCKGTNIKTFLGCFPDGEIFFDLQDDVTDKDVFIVQSTSKPANDHLIELLMMVDALKQNFAHRVKAVIPYFGYARQDRVTAFGSNISAKVIANLIGNSGIDQLFAVDLHSPQIAGFFPVPLHHLSAIPLFARDIHKRFFAQSAIIVSPDLGGIARSRQLAALTGSDIAIIEKERIQPGQVEVGRVIGDIKDRICILIDDLIDSGGTLVKAAQKLLSEGAKEVHAYATHAVFCGDIQKNIESSFLKTITVTDTILQPTDSIRVIPIGPLIAQEIFMNIKK